MVKHIDEINTSMTQVVTQLHRHVTVSLTVVESNIIYIKSFVLRTFNCVVVNV